MNRRNIHMCIHTVDPYDDDEFDQDSDDVSPDTGPEYDRDLDFNPRFGWSILDQPDGNDEVEE